MIQDHRTCFAPLPDPSRQSGDLERGCRGMKKGVSARLSPKQFHHHRHPKIPRYIPEVPRVSSTPSPLGLFSPFSSTTPPPARPLAFAVERRGHHDVESQVELVAVQQQGPFLGFTTRGEVVLTNPRPRGGRASGTNAVGGVPVQRAAGKQMCFFAQKEPSLRDR